MKKSLLILSAVLITGTAITAQEKHDKGIFKESKNDFYEKVEKEASAFRTKEEPKKPVFKMDFSGYNVPQSVNEFKYSWHNPPINQGLTGTCWSYSTTSFFESEVYRLQKKEVRLSEIYTAYWEYVEKARRFVRERGNSVFGEGSEANAVRRIWKQYGIVPRADYTGLMAGQVHNDHGAMYEEMKNYLNSLKVNNNWNEEETVATIKSILNHYIGQPPAEITVDGVKMTPKEYLDKVLKLKLDDYVDILSLLEPGYHKKVEYKVPDNWWHDAEYYNVPLDEFMSAIKNAMKKGYTIAIGGDVSEPGYDFSAGAAVVPSFDIPSEYIDDYARQFRFTNGTTEDDHGLHMVGYTEKDGKTWFMIKDSGAGAQNAKNRGYYFYHEDYVKLKIMDFMVHKDAVSGVMK